MAVEWHDGHANAIAKEIREVRSRVDESRRHAGAWMTAADYAQDVLDELVQRFVARFSGGGVDVAKFLERSK